MFTTQLERMVKFFEKNALHGAGMRSIEVDYNLIEVHTITL